jgi:carnitine O-acetyltransferase
MAVGFLTSMIAISLTTYHSFNACRIPTKPADTATKYSPESHNHIVFIRNNRFYEVDTRLHDGSEMSVRQLEA